MATPFVRESKRHQSRLELVDLAYIRGLLKEHGYSGVDYYDLGLCLGLLPSTLDKIEQEEPLKDVRRCLTHCLAAWLEKANDVNSDDVPTYDRLIQALRKIGQNSVADGIEREIGAKVSFESSPYNSPTKRDTVQSTVLDVTHLVDVLDLLIKHGYSDVNYYDLGLYLGLYAPTLTDIKHYNKGYARSCLRHCLKAWLERRDNVMSSTYDTLIQALRKMGENDVADGIEREIQAEVSFESPPSSPPTKRDTVQLTLSNSDEVFSLLERHGYSGINYYDLGLYLGLYAFRLDTIEIEYERDDRSCLNECLKAWLEQEDNVMSKGGPTYDTLIQALREIGENDVADRIEGKEQIPSAPSASKVQPNYSSNTSIPTEDTSATDRIQEIQNPLIERKIEKWLEEGEVELKITRINMHGAPGAGKTCSLHLLLNEPPPEKLTNSTPIACRAVKATRISIDDKNKKWERVDIEDLLNQLASAEVDKAPKPEDDVPAHSDEPSLEEPPKTELTENQSPENETIKIEPINPMENVRSESKPIKNKQAENKTTEMKSTKQNPAKNKPTKMELVKKMLQAFKEGKSKKFSTNWVYFIDSGGQPAYRELLPLFTRAAALNIITIDLTKDLDEKCMFQYRISQHASPINMNLRYSNCGIIRSTISSEAMLNFVKFPYVTKSEMPDHPHYLILGTRKELVTEEKLKKMNESLIEYKANKKVIPHNKRQGSIIFPVNTLLPAGSNEREKASVELCNTISAFGVAMTIKLPIRLFTFEIALQLEAEKKKRSFLTKGEVTEIGKSLQLDKESDINEALQYLHNVTIILYYHDVDILKDLIFVDPKPILDVLSHLIAVTYVHHTELQMIADPSPSIDERNNLIDFGLFKEDFLKIIGKKFFNKDFNSFHIITLLRHLHIIAEVGEEGDYFFPCALPSYDKLNPAPTKVQPLLIAWEIKNSGTKTLAIPQGLFPLTIVHLLEKKDSVEFTPDPAGNEYYRYNDAMSLCVYIEKEEYTIDIINCYTHIEIHLDESSKEFCPQIRDLVTDAIKRSSDNLKVDKSHIFAFKCLQNKQCYCIVKEDLSSTKCTQCRSHCKVLQGDDDSYRCWFSDCQSFSP
ncbi:PREDICTED: uncharacterized protein LOC109582865, partial [Amphimedon queenslandica]|uniref:Death domain-containing protein n=1 Tax=Amphimedon queenslandica TaxID=400682 RepID=A0AAN0J9S1_AMPQE